MFKTLLFHIVSLFHFYSRSLHVIGVGTVTIRILTTANVCQLHFGAKWQEKLGNDLDDLLGQSICLIYITPSRCLQSSHLNHLNIL